MDRTNAAAWSSPGFGRRPYADKGTRSTTATRAATPTRSARCGQREAVAARAQREGAGDDEREAAPGPTGRAT